MATQGDKQDSQTGSVTVGSIGHKLLTDEALLARLAALHFDKGIEIGRVLDEQDKGHKGGRVQRYARDHDAGPSASATPDIKGDIFSLDR